MAILVLEVIDTDLIALQSRGADCQVTAKILANYVNDSGGGGGGSGTVTTVSVVSANGFTGTVATATTTPAITLTTSVTGLLKGNGTAIAAASAGTDYVAPNATLTALAAATPVAIQAHRPINAQTGTSYTFVVSDTDELVTFNNSGAVAVTLPLHASVALSVLAEIDLFNIGAGAVTLTPTSGATINGSGSGIVINQWQGGTIKQISTDAWIYIGGHA